MRVYTIRDIAKRAGVGFPPCPAHSTTGRTSERKPARRCGIVDQLGYAPNATPKTSNSGQRPVGHHRARAAQRLSDRIAELMTDYGWEKGHQY